MMGEISQTNKMYVQAPVGCSKVQALAALYSLFFLPDNFYVVFDHKAIGAGLESQLLPLVNILKLDKRVIFCQDARTLAPLIEAHGDNPEAFASAVFAKVRS